MTGLPQSSWVESKAPTFSEHFRNIGYSPDEPQAFRVRQGSFDCVAAPRSEAATSLRMTSHERGRSRLHLRQQTEYAHAIGGAHIHFAIYYRGGDELVAGPELIAAAAGLVAVV